jgi:NAD(P)-dependent dehydrogenase (short-subunit alcohol dehydrogenase family)
MDPNKNEHPKAVVITGAADRIGLELAKECLDLGYCVIIHYRTSAKPAESVFKDDKRVTFIRKDLTESPEMQELFMDDVVSLPFKLTGLINNAAVFEAGDMSDPDNFMDILTVNTLIPLRLSAAFAKFVKSGWIVNITDAHTHSKNKKYQNYRVSKLFLDEITRQQAYLYAPGIRVNAIAPGAILPPVKDDKKEFPRLLNRIPLAKTGDPAHLRKALRFLVENDYMTGSVIPVDGGWGL